MIDKKIHSSIFLLGGFFLFLDQLCKYKIFHQSSFTSYLIKPWVGIEYFQNPGVAFGIPIPNTVTLVYTPLVLLVLLLALFKKDSSQQKIFALTLITFGALSNFVDRIFVGFTIDYIRIFTSIFNIADVMIVVGALMVLHAEFKKNV